MFLSPPKTTMYGHELQESYARGRKNSFVVKHQADVRTPGFSATNLLFVSVSHASVSHYGADMIMLLLFLACFATSLGHGILVDLSVGQQGNFKSVLYAHLTAGQGHHVQQAGQPGKESVHIQKGSVPSGACT